MPKRFFQVARVADTLGIEPSVIVDATGADNGPGWIVVRLSTVEEVLALEPRSSDLDVGVAGRVSITQEADSAGGEPTIWVGRNVVTCVRGTVELS